MISAAKLGKNVGPTHLLSAVTPPFLNFLQKFKWPVKLGQKCILKSIFVRKLPYGN